MSDSLDPRDELTERLAALGRQPVDPALQSQHLTAMASVRGDRSVFRASLAGRLKIGAGVLGGFLLGASGLATAGALGPLQPIVAERAAEVANVDLPQGPKDKAEKAAKAEREEQEKAEKARLADGSIGTARDWTNEGGEPCVDTGDGTFAGNRGLYLKQERAKGEEALEKAKASTCGMPLADDDAAGTTEAPKTESEDEGKKDDAATSGEDKGKSADAPGKTDDPSAAGKAKGDDAAGEHKPETPAGPPDTAGQSGVTPPVEEPPAEPAPAADAGAPEV